MSPVHRGYRDGSTSGATTPIPLFTSTANCTINPTTTYHHGDYGLALPQAYSFPLCSSCSSSSSKTLTYKSNGRVSRSYRNNTTHAYLVNAPLPPPTLSSP